MTRPRPVLIIAVVHLMFGIGAIVYSRNILTIVVVPALLLLAASWGQDVAAARVRDRTA